MRSTAVLSWNKLLLEQPSRAPAICSEVTPAALKQSNYEEKVELSGVGSTGAIQLSDWELEAIRRYRAIQNTQGNAVSQEEKYICSTATSGTLLELIIHLKLLPITDWRNCAQAIAGRFQGTERAPLNLLSYITTQLIVTHKLTPVGAAKLLVNIGGVLLKTAASPEVSHVVSLEDWDIAEELERSVYALQATEHSLFENFSSLLLDTALGEVIDGADTPQFWGILLFCFLVRRNKEFALAAWESDKKAHCMRMRRACDAGHALPTHIIAVISAIL